MNLGLKDKVIIVSGGAKGIGGGITSLLAAEGAIPVIIGRDEADNAKMCEAILSKGQNVFSVTADLNFPEACEDAINTIVSKDSIILWKQFN